MRLTEDSWRALACSSPWRWRTLHFTHTEGGDSVQAWVRRPGQLLVRDEQGRTTYESGVPHSSRTLTLVASGGRRREADITAEDRDRLPHEVRPLLRTDGLVAERPEFGVSYDDPMYLNYVWVAMLDPVELSHHTVVDHLRPGEIAGREVWRADVRATDGYDPRCSCCSLLWSEFSDRLECEELGQPYVPSGRYPDGYEVALDVGTGVVTAIRPLGVVDAGLSFSVEIHEVDTAMDDVFAGR